MLQKHSLLYFIFFIVFCANALSQTNSNDYCENATALCFNETIKSTNFNATINPCDNCSDWIGTNGCFELNNSVWFNFITNSNGGSATIKILNINCSSDTNSNYFNELEAVVLSADTNCVHTTYEFVSACVSNNDQILIDLQNLAAEQEYFVLIDGGTDINDSTIFPAECEFEIKAYGSAVDPLINAGNDIYTTPNTDTPLNGSGYGSPSWFPDYYITNTSIFNPVVFLDLTTTYELTITQNNGCEFNDQVTVYVQEPLEVFNTITPNGDGFNDQWVIKNIESYPLCRVSIFSRWGQRVFYNIGYPDSRKWDGTYNGQHLPADTYYYTIETGSIIGESTYSGYINLIR